MQTIEINTGMEENKTRDFLLGLSVPDNTRTWKPISYKNLINITLEGLDKCGFVLNKEMYNYSADGMKANGKYHLEYGNDNDMGLMIAWQNSYNKTLSLKFAIGGSVFICENGVVRGDIGTYKRKHIGDIQHVTPQLIKDYICT